MQHAQFFTYETFSTNKVNYSIRGHCPLVCLCFTHQPTNPACSHAAHYRVYSSAFTMQILHDTYGEYSC